MTDNTIPDQVKVGFIATGDEITCGDILNTNGQYCAKILHETGFAIPYHLITDDQEAHIVSALNFLLHEVDIIILIGGLGPTSDDRTRFALSKAIEQPLLIDEACWKNLQQRLSKISMAAGNNKQQALFPEGATILPNPNGTAAGCFYTHQTKNIFMLPGPPSECIPMFTDYVLPMLEHLALPKAKSKWLLLGANEGEIANLLDTAVGELATTGYRWVYPYLEYKLFSESHEKLKLAMTASEIITAPFFISRNNKQAWQVLLEHLFINKFKVKLTPSPLAEIFRHSFSSQQAKLLFSEQGAVTINLSGFLDFWQDVSLPCYSSCELEIQSDTKSSHEIISLYYRNEKIIEYLREIVCKQLLTFFGAL
jgi:nicotinamide-nucleotide amidase